MTVIISAEIHLCKKSNSHPKVNYFFATIQVRGFNRDNDENAMNFKTQFNRTFQQREVSQTNSRSTGANGSRQVTMCGQPASRLWNAL